MEDKIVIEIVYKCISSKFSTDSNSTMFQVFEFEYIKYPEQCKHILLYVVNAKFLINTIKTNIQIIEQIQLHTIQQVIDEVKTELGMPVEKEISIKLLTIKDEKKPLKIQKSVHRLLSSTDLKLLGITYE
jgi:hypothetical protein